ncbi:MAG: acyltransferase [Pseudomonadota bacterium]
MTTYHTFAVWRFIAALMVMAYHFLHYSENGLDWAVWFENMLPLLDLFFMISGYLIYDRYAQKLSQPGSYAPFLMRRMARLYPLHLATTGFFVLVSLAWQFGIIDSNAGASRYNWSSLPANLLLLQAWGVQDTLTFNYVSWSVSAEWFCYLMMPVILLVASRFGWLGLIVLAAVTYAGLEFAIAQGWTFGKFMADTKLWGAYRVFSAFCLGAVAWHLSQLRPYPVRSHALGWILGFFLVWLMFNGVNYYIILAGMVLALALAGAAELDNPDGIKWISPALPVLAVSFGIYLWHPVVETVLLSLVWNRMIGAFMPMPIEAFMVFAAFVTLLVALCSARYFEKPVAEWILARVKYRGGVSHRTASTHIPGE